MAVEWLNTERVEFLDYFRFMLRAMSGPLPKTNSAADEQIAASIETYARKGTHANVAEKAMYYEDWIGTEA